MAPAAVLINASSSLSDAEKYQLTDAVLTNLTSLELSNISLFQFGDTPIEKRSTISHRCKTLPGDADWPSQLVWKVLNLLTGGALIETVPIGAVCYPDNEHYDPARCGIVLANWTDGVMQ